MNSRAIGKYGENLARQFLENNGYKCLEMNYHSRYGEIDIILQKGDIIVFVEVKLRKKHSLVSARESVNLTKQRKLIKTALSYLIKNPTGLQPRFDVVSIITDGGDCSIEHIENAFELRYNSY